MKERGYYTLYDAGDLAHMAESQRRVPGIGIPIYRLGEVEPYTTMIRPDDPRTEIKPDGRVKAVKYEWPARLPLCLDMLPRFRDALTDISQPLWFTEGAKKSDALASQEQAIVPISVNGVWGWMEKDGKDADGNRYLLPDFRPIPLRGRDVVLAFDSDYAVNSHVRQALDEFARVLEARGARVGILQLPHLDDQKLGVDDALTDGWTFADLEQAVQWRDQGEATAQLVQIAEAERLRRENAQLRERLQWIFAALGNAALPAGQRLTLIFGALELWDQRNRYAGDEAVPVRVWKIAKESGQSDDVAGRHIKALAACGAWKRDTRQVRDAATGSHHTEVWLTPAPALARPREIAPATPKNWGGKRYARCECGSEDFVQRRTVVCARCGLIHGETQERTIKITEPQVAAREESDVAAAEPHDSEWVEPPVETAEPQVAAREDVPRVEAALQAAEREQHAPPDDPPLPLNSRRFVGRPPDPPNPAAAPAAEPAQASAHLRIIRVPQPVTLDKRAPRTADTQVGLQADPPPAPVRTLLPRPALSPTDLLWLERQNGPDVARLIAAGEYERAEKIRARVPD